MTTCHAEGCAGRGRHRALSAGAAQCPSDLAAALGHRPVRRGHLGDGRRGRIERPVLFRAHPLRLDNLRILAPDGSTRDGGEHQSNAAAIGSTVRCSSSQAARHLQGGGGQQWCLRFAQGGRTSQSACAATAEKYRAGHPGKRRRMCASPDAGPDRDLRHLRASRTTRRSSPTGSGLELVPVTHPNDLVAGEEATFTPALDGKPAPQSRCRVMPGGIRYRDKLGDTKVKTDETAPSPSPGRRPACTGWKRVVQDDKSPVKDVKQRRAGYAATLEVLPP